MTDNMTTSALPILAQPDYQALALAVSEGKVRAIDFQFAKFTVLSHNSSHECTERDKETESIIFWTAYLLSKAQGDNHVCLNLERLAQKKTKLYAGGPILHLPKWPLWQQTLLNSPVFVSANDGRSDNGSEHKVAPIIIDGEACYLARYWRYERLVADLLLQKISSNDDVKELGQIQQALEQLFPEPSNKDDIDWQKVACAMAAMQKLAVITGGPGTGKTTTVIRLLALILLREQSKTQQASNLVIRLVAPTGKAAVRMTESIRNAKQYLDLDPELKALIPEQASTIHRLLGTIPDSVDFRHHESRKLNIDLLVLDEASMVDLPLMAKLLSALPINCQIILLGDKDQLSSVEAGSILADLCASISQFNDRISMNYSPKMVSYLSETCQIDLVGQQAKFNHKPSRIADSICMLQKSHRFAGGIGELAQAVNGRHSTQAINLLEDTTKQDIELHDQDLQSQLIKLAAEQYGHFLQGIDNSPSDVIRTFDEFRVLCASRKGPMGTIELNKKIEHALPLSALSVGKDKVGKDNDFYPGRPVMISRNDYNVRLFNGDTGIVLPSAECGGELRVYFLQSDGTVRAVLPSRLPPHDTAFAMTIHKSQGSEFKHVALALAEEGSTSSLMSKEVVYTGITRAKTKVDIFTDKTVLKTAIEQLTLRQSGLKEKLSTP